MLEIDGYNIPNTSGSRLASESLDSILAGDERSWQRIEGGSRGIASSAKTVIESCYCTCTTSDVLHLLNVERRRCWHSNLQFKKPPPFQVQSSREFKLPGRTMNIVKTKVIYDYLAIYQKIFPYRPESPFVLYLKG